MAEFNSNIFLNRQAVDFGQIGEGFERGMRLGDMVRQRKTQELEQQKQNDIKEAYNSGHETRPDGSSFFNPQRVSEYLKSKGLGLEAQKFDQDYQAQQAAQLKSQLDNQYNQSSMVSSLLGTVRDQASYDAAKAQAMKFGIQGVDQLPAQYNPQFIDGLKAQYGKASMTYKEQLDDSRKREEAQARLAELGMKRQDRQDAINTRLEEKQMALMTPYGLANTPEDAKNIKAGVEEKAKFDEQIQELIGLRTKYEGGNLPGINKQDQERAEQLSNDLLLTYKNMAKLGVLSQSDEKIINSIIPKDPLRMRGLSEVFQGQDAVLNRLKSFKSDSDKDFKTKLSTRLRDGEKAVEKLNQSGPDQKKYKWQVVD